MDFEGNANAIALHYQERDTIGIDDRLSMGIEVGEPARRRLFALGQLPCIQSYYPFQGFGMPERVGPVSAQSWIGEGVESPLFCSQEPPPQPQQLGPVA
jgi:hypothetical protein